MKGINRRSIAATAGPWLAGVSLFARFNFEFSYETGQRDVPRLDSVLNGLPLLTIELLVLFLILRPVSYYKFWKRALVALVAASGWLWFLMNGVMHAPGWYFANIWWILGVVFCLVVLAFWSGLMAYKTSRPRSALSGRADR